IRSIYESTLENSRLMLRYPLTPNGSPGGFVLAVLDPGTILEQVARHLIGVNINLTVSQDDQAIYRLLTDSSRRWLDYRQADTLAFYDMRWQLTAWPSAQTAAQGFRVLPGGILLGGTVLSGLASCRTWRRVTAR